MTAIAFERWVERLRAELGRCGQRYLLAISGPADWCREQAARIPEVEQGLWLTTEPVPAARCVSPAKARSWLGLETGLLVCDVFSAGFDPSAVAALAGTVRAGGLIVLLLPPLADWPRWPDPLACRLTVHGVQPPSSSRYLERLARMLASDSRLMLITPDRVAVMPETLCPAPDSAPSGLASPEQQRVVEAILALADAPSAGALVVTAARGRGKSAALGMAIADWLSAAEGELWLTAPRLRNSDVIFRHLVERLPEARRGRADVTLGDAVARFIAPDALLQRVDRPALLIVDEAAAMPTAMLEQMLQRHERVVFSSTEQGYEGSARGFAISFRRQLDRLRPGWRRLTLEIPLRWSRGDRVEALLDELLLLEPALPPAPAEVMLDRLEIVRLDRDELVANEALLRALFGLLAAAHYQTTPMDLRHLLDGANIELWAAMQDGQPVAAVMAAREGGLDAALGREIFRGRRRPRGHLLPQLLAARGDDPRAVCQRCLRIIRIAVHPALQRRGIGSRLLDAVVAVSDPIDYIGASFAMNPGVLAFWRQCGFVPLHLGMRANTASGSRAVAVALGRSAAGQRLVHAQRRFFAANFACQLGDAFADVDIDTVVALLEGSGEPRPLSETELAQLEAVAWGNRGYESSCIVVRGFVLAVLRVEGAFAALTRQQRQVLIGRVLQKRGWREVATITQCHGRAEAVSLFRQALRVLLTNGTGESVNFCSDPLRGFSSEKRR